MLIACFEMKGKDEVFQLICLNVLSTVFVLVFRLDYIAVRVVLYTYVKLKMSVLILKIIFFCSIIVEIDLELHVLYLFYASLN